MSEPPVNDTLPDAAPLPAPSAHVVDAPQPAQPAPAAQIKTAQHAHSASRAQLSPSGEAWDAGIHETPPRIASRTGSWARIRGGAKGINRKPTHAPSASDAPSASVAAPMDASGASDPLNQTTPVDYSALGAFAANTSFSVLQVLGGEDFKPESGEEPALAGAFAKYLEAKQVSDIPPGWGLAIVAVGIIAKRLPRPTVKTRMRHLYVTALEWWAWLRSPIQP